MKYFVRYGEIGTKSPKIRRKFENNLIKNIQSELDCTFDNNQGRLTLITDEKDSKVKDVLNRTFGIVSYSPILETNTNKDDIDNLISRTI
jgi:thiamine biosynthesis protein ThiI